MPTPSPDPDYSVTTGYDLSDDAYFLELRLRADPRALVAAVVPDEDPAQEPMISLDPRGRAVDIPYEVMRWFLRLVEEEVDAVRAWMRLRPELVALVHRLRQEHRGVIDEAGFPGVLAEVRAAVPEADVATVLRAVFGAEGERLPRGPGVR
ncbi:hypothetical protein [Kitasatospora sp. NPDC056800]|uniref:hypothetical protein n=1 Tax=Kitasatospora sp. NPDC056800 TaxID=3345948 RepID=UPI00368842C9